MFYDISASTKNEVVKTKWVELAAKEINIPFCVAGGIKTLNIAERVLNLGADKISINTPALQDPELITNLANAFGSQCVVVGVDSFYDGEKYSVYAKTGDPKTKYKTSKDTVSWVKEAQERGAGEIVLNCINQDGVRKGYDLEQLSLIRKQINIPLIASGGAGKKEDFLDVFVGNIVDENDVSVSGVRPQPDGSFLINGSVTLRDLNRDYEWNLPDEEASTIAGLILHEARIIPDVGQEFIFYSFRFRILRKHRNQITQLRVWPRPKQNAGSYDEVTTDQAKP